jgi:serine/threonine protein kinase
MTKGRNGGSGSGDKLKIEREDLRFVLSAVFENGEILRDENLLDAYLSTDSTLTAASHKIPFHKLDVITEPGGRVHVGGGGIVIQCANRAQPTIKYALKTPRPSLFQGKGTRVQENYQAAVDEYLKHAPLSHENVARVFDRDEMAIPAKKGLRITHSVILMEWIDRAAPLNKYLLRSESDFRALVGVLTQCFMALAYIHKKSLIHWDLKSDNLLVNGSGVVKLMDIGNARRVDDPSRGDKAYSTRGNVPEEALGGTGLGSSQTGDSSRRLQVTLPSLEWDCPWLDLWMLARELNRLFDASPELARRDWKRLSATDDLEAVSREFLARKFPKSDDDAAFAKRFIQLIIMRLLHPQNPKDSMCYNTADHVVEDLGKLLPEFGAAQPIPELQAIPQRVLRIPSSGNVPWTKRVVGIFNGPTIQRLRRHKQLGAVSHVYPGASPPEKRARCRGSLDCGAIRASSIRR